jgi:hypothetical protein
LFDFLPTEQTAEGEGEENLRGREGGGGREGGREKEGQREGGREGGRATQKVTVPKIIIYFIYSS